MGLTVADVAQTLFPVATGTAQLASNGGLQAGFAALLQRFAGAVMPAAGGGADPLTLQLELLPEGGDGTGDETIAEALAAMCAGLGLAPQPLTVPLGEQATVGAASAAAAGISTAQLAALEAALADLSGTGGVSPADEASGGEGEAAAAPPVTPASASGPQAAPGATAPAIPAGSLAGAPPEAAAPPIQPPGQDIPAVPQPALASDVSSQAPPGGLVPANQVNGVVRSVGNAFTEDSDGPAVIGGPGAGQSHIESEAAQEAPQPVAELANVSNHHPAVDAAEVVEAPARPVADLPEAVRQVGRAVIERLQEGGGTTRIHLHPEELGRVSVDVRIEGGEVHLTVIAERPEAARLLREHAPDLAQVFREHGLDLHVQVGSGGQERGQGESTDGRSHRQRAGEPSFADVFGGDTQPVRTESRVRAAYNPDGLHMYRI